LTVPELDLMPVALDQCAVQMPIAVAHHHSIGLDNQHPGRRRILVSWRLMRLIHVRHCAALLAFQFRSDAFGLRAQGLAADVHTREIRQQLGCFAKRRDRPKGRLPVRQAVTGLLMWCQAQRLIGRAPTACTSPTVMPPGLQPDRTQPCLHLTRTA
jgi:hypothetical protein